MSEVNLRTMLNTTMKDQAEVQNYIKFAEESNLVLRSDRAKNWDNYKAVHAIVKRHPGKDSAILDAGGIAASALLPSLQRMGYKRLVALDLSNPQPPKVDGDIVYARGDITSTSYPNGHFDAVGCLSVIEHGVDVASFLKEMERIIKPGGTLIVSTDYWQTKVVNPDGRQAYGVPIHIFSEKEILELIKIAQEHKFQLMPQPKEIDLSCDQKTINWMGFAYTFIVLGFERLAD